MKLMRCFFILMLSVGVSFAAAGDSSYKTTAKDLPNGNILVTCERIDDPVLGEIVDVNGNIFSTIINLRGVIQATGKGLPATFSKNLNVYVDDTSDYDVELVQAKYDLLTFPGIFEVGRALTRNMNPGKVPYEPNPTSLTDGRYYPSDQYIAGIEFGNIRDTVRLATVTAQLTMVNQTTRSLQICKSLKIRLVKRKDKPGKNAILKRAKKVPRAILPVLANIGLNRESTPWPNELSDLGDMLVIYTARDAAAIQPYITHKQNLGFSVSTQEVAAGTNVKTIIQDAYNANANLMYVQLVGDWDDIQCDILKGRFPIDTAMGLVAGGDNYLDLMVGRFSADSADDVTTQVNKAIAWENNLPASGWMLEGLGIGGNDGPGDDGEYDWEQVDVIKNYKLLANQYTAVDECYAATASCISNSVNNGVGLINHCGHGAWWGWPNFDIDDVNALTNGTQTPIIFSVACNNGDYDDYECFAEVWLRKTDGGAVAALMGSIVQPWNPPMRGQDYFNDLLTGGYDYSTNPGNGISSDHGKSIFGSIVANGLILMIAESAATGDLETMKSWIIFGDCALQINEVQQCTPTDCHVNSIECGTAAGSGALKYGQVTVIIKDDCGKAVANAQVTGTFTGDFNETLTGTTNASGQVVFTTSTMVKKPQYQFCVDNVVHGTLPYDSTDNVETCDTNY